MIKLHNISKVFNVDNRPLKVLDQISLEIAQGEIFGVIGASGAGKSTLIRCVNLLERPTEGQVIIDGTDLMQLNEKQLILARRQIGMIFQHFNLLSSRTVFENVALALELSAQNSKKQIQQKVNELLELVGLVDKANMYPANLSGGQKQRVAIARALASDPKVLLCDEATSALDPATTQAILKLLKEINQRLGITILIITHEMEVIKQVCHQVAVLEKGKLVEKGAVSTIFSNPKTQIAQEFIRSTFNIGLPDEYLLTLSPVMTESKNCAVVQFEFTGESVDAPIFSKISKNYGVELSILTSQIDYVGGVKFGFTIAEIFGDSEMIEKSKQYLTENNVKYKVLGYVG